jgi:ribosome-associated heat shock protein Hsp15
MDKIRIDKWLWAARFFKTRSLAKVAIEGGKVKVDGQRAKPSREIAVGATLDIRQGWDDKVVLVTALSEQRRGAPDAAKLYQETPESVQKREAEALKRKELNDSLTHPGQRPTKRQRRQIHRFIHQDEL